MQILSPYWGSCFPKCLCDYTRNVPYLYIWQKQTSRPVAKYMRWPAVWIYFHIYSVYFKKTSLFLSARPFFCTLKNTERTQKIFLSSKRYSMDKLGFVDHHPFSMGKLTKQLESGTVEQFYRVDHWMTEESHKKMDRGFI